MRVDKKDELIKLAWSRVHARDVLHISLCVIQARARLYGDSELDDFITQVLERSEEAGDRFKKELLDKLKVYHR